MKLNAEKFSSDGLSLFYKNIVQTYSSLMRIRLINITLDDTVSLHNCIGWKNYLVLEERDWEGALDNRQL